ncbi:Cof-type HAD-IIB family hydrolase [Lederbergia sp. NSJ-179]|uniref:Cof-type HAD-IIB family hydrolase n=1 Tax=Lederbergia sp. NSJ-179 TaxID=2931402 RepID=UPI001FD05277|nr:Cof-type HAD-IIB family hydrolase [Lederbergia sp. NSJ-179]MCJ7840430.1 Cof-type HAD-IIB family hydrolase [Lederbergia sp. NSJ-179]
MIYKLLALNLDGTLLQDNGRINKVTREAIEFVRDKDVKIILTTSRNFPSAKRVAKSLKMEDHIVAHHGAFIGKELDKPVFIKRIPEDLTNEIIGLLESFSCQIKVIHEQFMIGNKMSLPNHLRARVVFQKANRLAYSEQYVDHLREELQDNPISPTMIEILFEHKNDRADAKKVFEELYDEIECIESSPFQLTIVPTKVSKLRSVQYLCEQHGIKREEVVAIGSDLDDLPLIKWAGLGVAMGNAPAEVRKAADWITRSYEDNGVAYMVKEHFRKQHRLTFLRNILEND